MRLAWLIGSLLIALPVGAQNVAPSVHWGGLNTPAEAPELRFGLTFNRFTEFSSTRKKFNDIDETSGFNFLSLSYTDVLPNIVALPEDQRCTFTAYAAVSPTNDQPTRAIQNDFLHEVWGLKEVPVGRKRDSVDFMAGGRATYWFPRIETASIADFVFNAGLGIDAGTLYQEAYVGWGMEVVMNDLPFVFTTYSQVGAPRPGDAYEDVADVSCVSQLFLAYTPRSTDSLLSFLGDPSVGVGMTYDTGLFEDLDNDAIDTWFLMSRVAWPTGITFEIWNDILNGSDFGPTFGFTLSFDLLVAASYL